MFSQEETQSLLAEKGIGKTVLQRLQQMGLDDVAKLAATNVDDMLQQGAALTGSTCWKNSPQARAAMQAAVDWAKRRPTAATASLSRRPNWLGFAGYRPHTCTRR